MSQGCSNFSNTNPCGEPVCNCSSQRRYSNINQSYPENYQCYTRQSVPTYSRCCQTDLPRERPTYEGRCSSAASSARKSTDKDSQSKQSEKSTKKPKQIKPVVKKRPPKKSVKPAASGSGAGQQIFLKDEDCIVEPPICSPICSTYQASYCHRTVVPKRCTDLSSSDENEACFCRPSPIRPCDNLTMSLEPMDSDTEYKSSYRRYSCYAKRKPIKPCDHSFAKDCSPRRSFRPSNRCPSPPICPPPFPGPSSKCQMSCSKSCTPRSQVQSISSCSPRDRETSLPPPCPPPPSQPPPCPSVAPQKCRPSPCSNVAPPICPRKCPSSGLQPTASSKSLPACPTRARQLKCPPKFQPKCPPPYPQRRPSTNLPSCPQPCRRK